jgi:hypothetical protein
MDMTNIDQDPALAEFNAPRVPSTLDYIGLGGALIPFVLSFRSSQSQSSTTTVTDADGNLQMITTERTSFSDPIALVGGAVAIIVALVLLTQVKKVVKPKRLLRIGLALAILGLGAFQLCVRSGILG